MLYMLVALLMLSARLLVLMLFLCSEKVILLGLGSAPARASVSLSFDTPILPGREKSPFWISPSLSKWFCLVGFVVHTR